MTSANGSSPELCIAVEIPDQLGRHLKDAPDGEHGLSATIGSRLNELLEVLGIPGRTRVEVAISSNLPAHEWMRLRVGSRPCRYSNELLARVAALIDGRHVPPPPAVQPSWPEQAAGEQPPWRRMTELLTRLAVEVVKLQPAMLLGDAQCRAFGGLLRESRPDLPPELLDQTFLSQVLTGVLQLGISVADVHRVADALGSLDGADSIDARELLIAALSTDVVELLVPDRFQAQLGTGDLSDDNDLLAFLARGMFAETGIVFPILRYASSTDLPEGFFAFRVNHVSTTPWKCLDDREILVNEAADHMSGDASAQPCMNPATGQPAAITALADKETLEQAGYTTWTPSGHIILCLAEVLRTSAGRLVHQDKVQAQLDTLETVVPAAVAAARMRLSLSRLTTLIRALAADRVPLYHFPVLLERVIEMSYAEFGMDRLTVLGDPVTGLHSGRFADDATALETFVRTGLRREIADHRTGRYTTLVAYLLDPSIERLLRSPRTSNDDDDVVAAFREELLLLPQTARMPAVLTADDVRLALRDLLAHALPRISVVGYGDLPAELNVQPIARVQLPERETKVEELADALRT